jgi:sensor histidine kinase YesM
MVKKDGNLLWILASQHRWLQHPVFWLSIYFPRILEIVNEQTAEIKLVHLFILLSNMALVYFNMYQLVPEYFSRGQVGKYVASTVATVCSMAMINASFLKYVTTSGGFEIAPFAKIAENVVFTFSLLMTALAFHIIKRFMVSQSRLKHAENAQLQTELNFLKSQINPHFLFNALNNIHVQSRINPSEASDSILRLSSLLRYQLYDSARDKVNLQDEINFLQNFLQINKMRTGDTDIDFQVQGDLEGVKISPYLFIPFVENAVKHSRGLGGAHKVRIKMIVNRQELFFEIENSKPKIVAPKKSDGGIGLINISRRLDLLYPKRYQIEINNAYNAYLIRLRLKY